MAEDVAKALETVKNFIIGMEEGRFTLEHVDLIEDDILVIRDRLEEIREKLGWLPIAWSPKFEELYRHTSGYIPW